jgi:hypothetical protein
MLHNSKKILIIDKISLTSSSPFCLFFESSLLPHFFRCRCKWPVLPDSDGGNSVWHELHIILFAPSLKLSLKCSHTIEVLRLPRFVLSAFLCASPSFESSLLGVAAVFWPASFPSRIVLQKQSGNTSPSQLSINF